MTFIWEETGRTPNGTPWPINYGTHTQAQMDYAFRSVGSWMPYQVMEANIRLQAQLDRVRRETGLTEPREVMWALLKEKGLMGTST